MKNRGSHEIIADMLAVASNQTASRSTIMYRSFISHAQLKEYLLFLLEKGLIVEYQKEEKRKGGEDRTFYRITEKGLHLLQLYNKMNDLIDLKSNKNRKLI
jgi:predicted transcriptional regulator